MLDIITAILGFPFSLIKKAWRTYKLYTFRRKPKRPPLSPEQAKDIAYACLSGKIVHAVSYRHFESDKISLAVSYWPYENRHSIHVAVLEQIGDSYRVRWGQDFCTSNVDLDIDDLDRDGIQEVIVCSYSSGTGAHTSEILIYSQRDDIAYEVVEHSDRQNLAGPVVPRVTIRPEPSRLLKRSIEAYATKKGFFSSNPSINWDSEEHAIPRWHRDNGPSPSGKLRLTFYKGAPPQLSSVVASFDDGKILWTSYFKNPLIGYIKDEGKWFIAYSPSNFYEWACSLAHDGKRLWFGIHSLEVSYSFDIATLKLYRHESIKDISFKMDTRLLYKDGRLFVNDSASFAQEDLDRAIQDLENALKVKNAH